MRRVYIDLGANRGDTVAAALEEDPAQTIYAFEPNPKLAAHLRDRFGERVEVVEAACWISNGTAKLYLGHDVSSTLVEGKRHNPVHPEFDIGYRDYVQVATVDFARWLLDVTKAEDQIVVKMDIEGDEYKVIDRMIETGAMALVAELRCEWHWNRFPISKEEHDRIEQLAAGVTRLVRWN